MVCLYRDYPLHYRYESRTDETPSAITFEAADEKYRSNATTMISVGLRIRSVRRLPPLLRVLLLLLLLQRRLVRQLIEKVPVGGARVSRLGLPRQRSGNG